LWIRKEKITLNDRIGKIIIWIAVINGIGVIKGIRSWTIKHKITIRITTKSIISASLTNIRTIKIGIRVKGAKNIKKEIMIRIKSIKRGIREVREGV